MTLLVRFDSAHAHDHVSGLAPDAGYIEFGVGHGHSLARWVGRGLCLGVDVFTGLPRQWKTHIPGTFACDPRETQKLAPAPLLVGDICDERIGAIVRAVVTAWRPRPLVIHLDADLYEPTRDALRWTQPMPGDFVIADEYSVSEGEERKAVDEWAASAGASLVFQTGQVAVWRRDP